MISATTVSRRILATMPLVLNGPPLPVSSFLLSSSAWEEQHGKKGLHRPDVALASADEEPGVQEAEAASFTIKNMGHENLKHNCSQGGAFLAKG